MCAETSPEQATLLEVLVGGFEKNETLGGRHWRTLPMPDESAAVRKFSSLSEEARRWKGPPEREEDDSGRRMVAWFDLEIRQAGRGILIAVRTPQFDWWNEAQTWKGDPMGAVFAWFSQERASRNRGPLGR